MAKTGKRWVGRGNSARQAVDRTERIVLSKRDTGRVLKLLKNPPKPAPALIAAARRHMPR